MLHPLIDCKCRKLFWEGSCLRLSIQYMAPFSVPRLHENKTHRRAGSVFLLAVFSVTASLEKRESTIDGVNREAPALIARFFKEHARVSPSLESNGPR